MINRLGPEGTRAAMLGVAQSPFTVVSEPAPADTAGMVLDAQLADLDQRVSALESAEAAEGIPPVVVVPDSVA